MIRFACPSCAAEYRVKDECAGRKTVCPRCKQRIQVPTPPRRKTMLGRIIPTEPVHVATYPVHDEGEDYHIEEHGGGGRLQRVLLTLCLPLSLAFSMTGGVLGYFSAHYYPFWGNSLQILGDPHSPARDSLVPSHVVAFAMAGLLVGLGVPLFGYLLDPVTRRR